MPKLVVNHPYEIHSGLKFEKLFEIARGAGFARMLGLKSILVPIYFAIKKYSIYKNKHSFIKELGYLYKGIFQILLSNEK